MQRTFRSWPRTGRASRSFRTSSQFVCMPISIEPVRILGTETFSGMSLDSAAHNPRKLSQSTTQLLSEDFVDGFWNSGGQTELGISTKCGSSCQVRRRLDLTCPGMVRQELHNQEAFHTRRVARSPKQCYPTVNHSPKDDVEDRHKPRSSHGYMQRQAEVIRFPRIMKSHNAMFSKVNGNSCG